mgnify:FL=1
MSLFKTTKTTSYSFKSSGNTISEESSFATPEVRKPPIGIQTPLRVELGQGLFTMHTDITKVISDNLRNLILTNHGERLGFPDFGADLRPILFDLGNEAGDQLAISKIRNTVGKYMPFVSLQGFQTFVDPLDENTVAKVGIQITYKIPSIDEVLRSLEVMLYVGG